MLNIIVDNWPELGPYLPDSLEPAPDDRVSAGVLAYTTHPGAFRADWADAPAGVARFALAPAVPEGLVAVGIHSTQFEHLFVMWVRGGRRFHFREVYAGGDCMPDGPADMRMVMHSLARVVPQNFGHVVPVFPERIAELESAREGALAALGRVKRLHARAGLGWCSACGGVPWPCPTWEAATSPAEERGSSLGAAC